LCALEKVFSDLIMKIYNKKHITNRDFSLVYGNYNDYYIAQYDELHSLFIYLLSLKK